MAAVGYTSGDPRKVDVAGDTMTGALVLPGDPDAALKAATKQYVDNLTGGGSGTYVDVTGDTMTGSLVLSGSNTNLTVGGSGLFSGHVSINATSNASNDPIGPSAAVNTGINVLSSYAGGDDDGVGTDSTGRINLYSYQRANQNAFGENIRNFAMRSDAKTMQAFYMPVDGTKKGGYDPTTRDPKASGVSWKPVVWQGAHYEANNHGSIHGHWELEIADSTGALQGRLEIPFIDQATDGSAALDEATIGVDYTNIRTNLADFSVRAQNIGSGPYSGQNTGLRIGGNNSVNKDLMLSISSDMASSGRRWVVRANTTTEAGANAGTDLQILNYDDSGTVIGTALGIERASGNVTIGAAPPGALAKLHVSPPTTKHGIIVKPASSQGSNSAYAAQLTATTDRLMDSRVTGDGTARLVQYTDGKLEWGDGTNARDVTLFRDAADRLRTNDSLRVDLRLGVGATPGSTDSITVIQTSDANTLNSTNSASGGNVNQPHIRCDSATSGSLFETSRVTGDSVSRFARTIAGAMSWGDGTGGRDTNLYRGAADVLQTDDSFMALGRALGCAQARDAGYAAWSYDYTSIVGGNTATAGVLYLNAIYIPYTVSVTKIHYTVTGAGNTPVSGQNFVAIYNASGTKLVEAGIDSSLGTGRQAVTISSTQLTAGMYWVAILANCASGPSIGSGVGNSTIKSTLFGTDPLTAATLRFATNGTSLTAAPSSITPSSNSGSSAQAFWVAVA